MTVAERIRFYRRQLGISQIELAEKLFVSIDTVRRWEQGKRVPHIGDELIKLAAALHITPSDLVMTENFEDFTAKYHDNFIFVPVTRFRTNADSNSRSNLEEEIIGRFPVSSELISMPANAELKIYVLDDDSLLPKYQRGDLALSVNSCNFKAFSAGDLATLLYDGKFYIRGYFPNHDGSIDFKALSQDVMPIHTSREDPRLRLVGKAICVFRIIRNTGFFE